LVSQLVESWRYYNKMSTPEDEHEHNRKALKKFYEKKDPNRVKNVEPLFLRFEEADIIWYVEHKYGETVEGWMDATHNPDISSPISQTGERKSQGFFGSAKSLLSVGSQKNVRGSLRQNGMVENPLRKSLGGSNEIRRVDSSDSDVSPAASQSFLPPPSPVVTTGSMKSMTIEKNTEKPKSSSPVVEHVLSKEEADAKMQEISRKEREALEQAREEERRIREALIKGREAIERAKRELAEKEKELGDLKRQMEEEMKLEAAGNAKPARKISVNPTVLQKAQEVVQQKQFEAIVKLEEAERERIVLEEQNQMVKLEYECRSSRAC